MMRPALLGAVLCLLACESPPAPAPTAVADLIGTADSLHLAGSFDSARALWGRVLNYARESGRRDLEGRALTGLGLAAYRTGAYGDARQHLGAAIAVQHAAQLDTQFARSYNALGLVAYQQGRLLEAAALYDTSVARARAVADSAGVGRALGNLGLVRFELGEFENARRGLEAMREAAARSGDARMHGNALNNLGMLHVRLGRPRQALAALAAARSLYASIEYRTGEQNNLGQLATAYAALGQLGRAFAVLDSALVLCRELGLRQEEASNLEVLASLHAGAGDPRRALRLYTDAQVLNEELELEVERGTNARQRALLQRDLGRPDLAEQLALEALGIHRAGGARFEELRDLLLLAELAPRTRETAWLAQADTLAVTLNVPAAEALVTLARARIADRHGTPDGVLRALAPGPALWEMTGYAGRAEGFALRARAHARRGAMRPAIADGRAALEAGDRIRAGVGSAELRSRIAAAQAAAQSDLVSALLREDSLVQAFEVADRLRGRILLEHLEVGSSALRTSRTDANVLRRESLLRQIGELMTRRQELSVAEIPDPASLQSVEARIADAQEAYEALLARSARAPAIIGGGLTEVAAVQRVLGPDEVLLEYLIAPDRLHVFVLTPTRLAHVEQPIPVERLAHAVRIANELLADDATNPGPVLRTLHEWLIDPVKAQLPAGATIVVVTHGILSRVPFAALRDGEGNWLVQRHPLLHVPSAGALHALRTRRPEGGTTRAQVFAPLPESLPGTAREAAAVARVIRGARIWLGSDATEPRVRHALGRRGITHVATHGWLNEGNPAFSRIDLFPVAATPDRDGRLEVHELFGRRLSSDLAFLSGCETGGSAAINPYQGGEEYAALAQVLLHGGVRNVVATTRRIDDAAAAELAARFYLHLPGRPPAAALAAAQRDLLRLERFSHPHFWAAHQASGDGRPVLAHSRARSSVQ